MPHRSEYRSNDVPNKPGVYVFRDRFGEVLYVGKAKALRRRLSNYFQPSRARTGDPKLRSLLAVIDSYELHPVRTEEEALLLEASLVKQYDPRFNILLRDDKRFLLIRIDLNTPFPRLQLARLRKDDGCVYFGPFPLATALRDTVDYLNKHFGLRSCRPDVPGPAERRHCLDHIVRHCSAPCELMISEAEYHARIHQLIAVVDGDVAALVADAQQKMADAAAQQQFESAARLRDVAVNLKSVFGAQNRSFTRTTLATYPGEAGVLDLQQALGLAHAPRRIECFDISNTQGLLVVASLVCFADGLPARKDYRHFHIKTVIGPNDFASMQEVVGRRYRRQLAEQRPLPDLVLVDGGLGQLHAAAAVMQELALTHLPLIGLAKQQEEVFTLRNNEPILLDRARPGLKLLQAIRDEAHRFGITFHRELRRKRILDSLLDEIPGIGKTRKVELLKTFGSVSNLRKLTAAQIAEKMPGVGLKLASEITAYLAKANDDKHSSE